MKNFFQKQREFVSIFLFVTLVGGLIYFVMMPLISKINSIRDEIQEESLRQESSRMRLNNLPKVQDQYKRLEESQAAVDVLLDKNNAVVLIEQLEKLAEQSGDKIKISVQDQPAEKGTSSAKKRGESEEKAITDELPSKDYLQLKITLDGNFEAIGKFVKELESFQYYSDIIGVEIKKSDGEDESTGQGGDFGYVSPFAINQKKQEAAPKNEDSLEAVLDVVFYTK